MTEKIYVYINGEEVELLGLEREKFVEQRKIDNAEYQAQELAKTAKENSRKSALAKLAALGLTEDEIASL
jgi:hypothetical protein